MLPTTPNIAELPPLGDWLPLAAFVAENPNVTPCESTLRWQLRHREINGLAPAVVRSGKRLLISKTRYAHWLATRASSQLAEAA